MEGGQVEALRFAVGEIVVYGFHGVGRIAATGGEAAQTTIVLEFRSGLRVTLPLHRAHESLRAVSSRSDLVRVAETLGAAESASEPQWSKRCQAIRVKLSAGQVVGLAEVVRDGAHRQRRLAVRPSPAEHELYERARQLLTDEISASRGTSHLEAENWINDQLAPVPSDAARDEPLPGW